MDDARAWPPEACAVLSSGRAQEVIDFAVLGEGLAQVGRALDARLYQMVAVNSRGDSNGFALRLHKLEHAGLPKHILQNHAVRAHIQVALAGNHLLILRVIEMA